MLQYALLWLFHLVLALRRFVSTLLPRRQPNPLRSQRRKLPGHLAVLLRHGESRESRENQLLEALESVRRLAAWCRIAGIRVLSVYDEEGQLWSHILLLAL
jgi:dehydrodolichyl diphosphate syntase complex subunit NUS1